MLTACPLRFDGYKYCESSGFDHQPKVERYIATGQLPSRPEEMLTLFFMLQRFLMKWGGEQLPQTGPEWRAFRELFVAVCGFEVPGEYQQGDHYARWLAEYRPRIQDCVQIVRKIHKATKYSSGSPSLHR